MNHPGSRRGDEADLAPSFFGNNVFKSGTNLVNPFVTPFGAPVHFR